MCKLHKSVHNPVVKITIELEQALNANAELLYEAILKNNWNQNERPNSFSSQFYGTIYKEEHIDELIGYAEEVVIKSTNSLHNENDPIEGTTIIDVESIGKYQFNFSSFPDSFEFTEELETYYSTIEEE